MKRLPLVLLGLLLLSAIIAGKTSTAAQGKVEYKLDLDCSEKDLNARGAEGWQLAGMSASSYNGVTTIQCAFRR